MELLYFFESIRTPFLNAIMLALTVLGSETAFLVLALLLFWCVDKTRGYLVLSVGLVGTVINLALKLLFRIPRPWILDHDFTIVEGARAGATGYSFPSGHTQNSVGTFGSVAATTTRRWVRAVSIALLLLVPLSRMYLGVHTPLDVGVSFAIALALVAVGVPLMKCFGRHEDKLIYLFISMLALTVVYTLFVELYRFPADLDAENYMFGRKNAYSLLGATLGMCIAHPLERRYVRYMTQAVWWVQAIKLAGGLALTIGLKSGLKWLLTLIFGADFLPANAIRYAALILFAALVWPMTFRPLCRLAGKGGKS